MKLKQNISRLNRLDLSGCLFRISLFLTLMALVTPARAILRVDPSNPTFAANAQKEIEAMRSGKRGIVCQALIERLDVATATTTVRPLTSDESTWHPNDPKGTRSHTVALDTRIRGGERTKPTNADIFIQMARVDSTMSLYRLGTFVHELALAADLNDGRFSADYRTREKRASFYRNAWLDSLGLRALAVSDRVPTPEYSEAKNRGFITEANKPNFPLLELPVSTPVPSPVPPQ